ncbi:DUF2946 family protein [Propionivibrio sp.]|uniref:DUF2946 family protein n=1 Tax=Propionivibrio sp. TaxID=2212460 RepID=UPI003BF38589
MKMPDFSGMLRWPNVPACYGWLSLDRRGQWRMRREAVTHAGLVNFLNRQYGHDEHGNFFVQNGPQRVFVELEYTPWVLRLSSENTLLTHTGDTVEEIHGAAFDEEGNLLLECLDGIALLCDRDLPALLACLRQPGGEAANDADLLDLLDQAPGTSSQISLEWNGKRIPVGVLRRCEVALRYGFVASPVQSSAPGPDLPITE